MSLRQSLALTVRKRTLHPEERLGLKEVTHKTKEYTKDYKLHELSFSTTERAMPEVPPPESRLLTDEEFFLPDGKPNAEVIKEHLRREGTIPLA